MLYGCGKMIPGMLLTAVKESWRSSLFAGFNLCWTSHRRVKHSDNCLLNRDFSTHMMSISMWRGSMYSKPGCQNHNFFWKMLARKDLRVFSNTPGLWKMLKIIVEACVSCSLRHTEWQGLRLKEETGEHVRDVNILLNPNSVLYGSR